jgi:hypothetical protein
MFMCRFPSKEDEGYKQVSGEIKLILIKVEERLESQRRNNAIVEPEIKAPSQATGSPYCMHPRVSLKTPFSTVVENAA